MSSRRLRLLVVGAGVRGGTWARIVHEDDGCELAGTVDPDPARKADFVDLESALTKRSPDAVIVATPPTTHEALVSLAVSKGCHVLCEKPLAEDLEAAASLVEQAGRAGVSLLVGMNFRYLPSSLAIRRVVSEGELGEPCYGAFQYVRHRDGRRPDLNDYPLEMDYPFLYEQAVHHFDLLRFCYGREVEALVADSFRPSGSTYRGDCCLSVLFRFRGGLRVFYSGTWTASWNEMSFRFRTELERGILDQRSQFGDLHRVDFRPELGLSGARFKSAGEAEPASRVELPDSEPLVDDSRLLLGELAAAVRGEAEPATSGRDHLETLGLVVACRVSHERESWVRPDALYREMGLEVRNGS